MKDATKYAPGDWVKNCRFPKRKFKVITVKHSRDSAGKNVTWLNIGSDTMSPFWCDAVYCSIVPNPQQMAFDFDLFDLPEIGGPDDREEITNKIPESCEYGHHDDGPAIQLIEKQFEWWVTCKNCGAAIRKFETNS